MSDTRKSAITLAFDVYGTLIDPLAIAQQLCELLGEEAIEFAQLWRDKQLEYTFRRALMQRYVDFSVCTSQALDYTCLRTGHELSATARQDLLASYTRLPAFAEVPDALASLRAQNHRLFGFSNGKPEDLVSLFDQAGLRDAFDGMVSVHERQSFKPAPGVYQHFNATTVSMAERTWLVSSNPFDVIGARATGWQAVWVQRDPAIVFDPWEWQPTHVISSLSELPGLLHSVS